MHSLVLTTVLAAESAGGGAGGLTGFLPLLLIVATFYLLLIRPQQKKTKQHQELVQSVGTGDRIVTIGGLHGTVETLDDETARIEIAPGTVITLTRGAIARRLVDADTAVVGTTDEDPTTPAGADPMDTP